MLTFTRGACSVCGAQSEQSVLSSLAARRCRPVLGSVGSTQLGAPGAATLDMPVAGSRVVCRCFREGSVDYVLGGENILSVSTL